MSTETIVNRVSQLPIQAGEQQALTEIQTTEPDQLPVPRAQVTLSPQIDSTTVQAIKELEKSAPLVEEVSKNPEVVEQLAEQGLEISSNPVDTLRAILRDDVLFRQQVITAFRHLGLDTKKHFGV